MKLLALIFFVLPMFIYSQESTNTSYFLANSMSQNNGDPIDIKIMISITVSLNNMDQNKIIIHSDEPLYFDVESIKNIEGSTQYNCIDPNNDHWIVSLKTINTITLITFLLDSDKYFTYSCKQVYDE